MGLLKQFEGMQLPAASELEWLVPEHDAPQKVRVCVCVCTGRWQNGQGGSAKARGDARTGARKRSSTVIGEAYKQSSHCSVEIPSH